LRKRLFYANVHTTKAPGGEIRGNFLALANAYFTANLNSRNENPPLAGNGAGAIKAELLGDKLTVTGSFANLSGELNRNIANGAHLHNGANGTNGPVLVSLKTDTNADNKGGRFFSDSNVITLTTDQLALLNAGNLYVNVHSTTAPAGEIRGQLLFEPNAFPTAPNIISPNPSDTIKTRIGVKDSTFTITWSAATDPDNNPLIYLIQISLTPDFSMILNTSILGSVTSITTPIDTVDTFLALLGIPPGTTITLFNRVLASDGSLITPGNAIPLIIHRGLSTPVGDQFIRAYSLNVFPVPAKESVILELNAIRATQMDLNIIDISGRNLYREKLQVQTGLNQFPLDLKNFIQGIHFVILSNKGNQ